MWKKIIVVVLLILGLQNITLAATIDTETLKAIAYIAQSAALTEVVFVDSNDQPHISPKDKTLDFGEISTFDIVKDADQFLRITYSMNVANGAIAVYTDNQNSSPKPYTHDWAHPAGEIWDHDNDNNTKGRPSPQNGAGLVFYYTDDNSVYHPEDIRSSVPLLWAAFDNVKQAKLFNFAVDPNPAKEYRWDDFSYTNDKMQWNFTVPANTVVFYANGNPDGDLLTVYPNRDTNHNLKYDQAEYVRGSSPVYLAFAGNFRGAFGDADNDPSTPTYFTSQLVVEMYNQ